VASVLRLHHEREEVRVAATRAFDSGSEDQDNLDIAVFEIMKQYRDKNMLKIVAFNAQAIQVCFSPYNVDVCRVVADGDAKFEQSLVNIIVESFDNSWGDEDPKFQDSEDEYVYYMRCVEVRANLFNINTMFHYSCIRRIIIGAGTCA